MSANITRIKERGATSGAAAYAGYALAQEEHGLEAEATEVTAESAEHYTEYVAAEGPQTTRWLGHQAAAWGLEGKVVTKEALTAALSHKDPTTGADLDAARVARLAKQEEMVAKWQLDKKRWKESKKLQAQADAFDALRDEVEKSAVRGLDEVVALIDTHLGEAMTDKQQAKVLSAATRAILRHEDLNAALRTQQGRMRLIPPAKVPPQVSGSPTSEVIGYDLTLTGPRGADFFLTVDALRDRAMEAQSRAAERTLRFLEEELTATRSGAGGRDRRPVTGLAIAAVTHFTGRPAGDPPLADPDLHMHCVIGSMVYDPLDDTWKTIDSQVWFRTKGLIQGIYDGELRAELTAEFGVDWRERETREPVTGHLSKHWEMIITGDSELDDKLIESYSRRRSEIVAEVEKRLAAGETVNKDVVWGVTRQAKDELPLSACRGQWDARLAAFGAENGIETDHLIEGALNRASDEVVAKARRDLGWANSANSGGDSLAQVPAAEVYEVAEKWTAWVGALAEDLAQQRASFGRDHLLRAALKSAPKTTSPSLVIAQVDAYLKYVARTIVPLGNDLDPTAWTWMRWTTDAQVDREWEALVNLNALMQPAGAAVSATTAQAILKEYAADRGTLNLEQELLFLAALRDEQGGQMTACVAPAGAGKSYVAAAIAEAWRWDGIANAGVSTRKVVTLALASRAGVGVSQSIKGGADFEGSIDRLLVALEHDAFCLDEGTLVIIDEGSMASLVKMHDVLVRIKESGARVLIFGDPEQIDAPGAAGGLLHWLDAHGAAVRFDTTVRNRDEAIRAAQLGWRSGLERDNPVEAAATLSAWVERGLISVVDGETTALELTFERWCARYEEGAKRLAQWEADRQRLERAVAETPKKSTERATAEADLGAHLEAKPDTSILTMAERHEDVAQLSDRIQGYLVAHGAIDTRSTVAGVRYAPLTKEEKAAEAPVKPLMSATGEDISKVDFAKGLEVRVTTNTKSGHIEKLLADAIAKEEVAYDGKAPWKAKFAYGRSNEVRELAKKLKGSSILNGELGTVENVHRDGGLTVRLPGARGLEDRLVRMSREQLIEGKLVPAAGGAITVHAGQGRDVETTITLASKRISGDHLYVAQSRSHGDSELIFAADLELKDPRFVQWENNRRKVRLEGEEFLQPAPKEEIPGLWQLADRWSTSNRSTLAIHEAEKDAELKAARSNARQKDGAAEIVADSFVTPGDQAEALQLVNLQGSGDLAHLAQQIANGRAAQERAMAEATQERRKDLQRTEGLVREMQR